MNTLLTATFSLSELPGIQWLAGMIAVFFVLLYGVAPLVVKMSVNAKRDSPVQLIAEDEVPQTVRSFWYASAPQLEQLGFRNAVQLSINGPVGDVTNYLQIQFLESGETLVSQTAIMTADGRIQAGYEEFITSFSGDRAVLTQNAKVLSSFAEVPEKRVACFAGKKDLAALYSAHLKHLRLYRFGTPLPQGPSGIVELIERSIRLDFERQVERGYFRVSSDGSRFEPTLPGAFLMTWRQLHPWKALLKLERRRRCREILAVEPSGVRPAAGMASSISPN